MSKGPERTTLLRDLSINAAAILACGAIALGIDQIGTKKHSKATVASVTDSTPPFNKNVFPNAPELPGLKPVVDVKGSYLYPGTPVKSFQQLNLGAVAKERNSEIQDDETGQHACEEPFTEIDTPTYTEVAGKDYLVSTYLGYVGRRKESLQLDGIAITNLAKDTNTVDNLFFAFYDHHRYNLTAIVSGRESHSDYYDNAYLNIPNGIPTPDFIKCVPHKNQ